MTWMKYHEVPKKNLPTLAQHTFCGPRNDWGLNVETDCGCTTGNACEAVVMMVHHLEFPIEIIWQFFFEFYWFLVKVTKAFAVVGRCKFLLAMALQRCKVCSFIVALIFMLVPFRHRRWSSHRGIWATTSTSSRCVKKSWTQRSEYIFWGTTKEIHWNPLVIQSLAGHSCMLKSLLPLFVARNWSPCFQDGKFAVQTEGVTKVWWSICGDVSILGIFKTYWEWMMLLVVEIQSFFGVWESTFLDMWV